MARKLKIMLNEKHPFDDLKNDEITEKREKGEMSSKEIALLSCFCQALGHTEEELVQGRHAQKPQCELQHLMSLEAGQFHIQTLSYPISLTGQKQPS